MYPTSSVFPLPLFPPLFYIALTGRYMPSRVLAGLIRIFYGPTRNSAQSTLSFTARPLMRRYCDPAVRSCILLCSIRRIRSGRRIKPDRLFARFSDPTFVIAPRACVRACVCPWVFACTRFIILCSPEPASTVFTKDQVSCTFTTQDGTLDDGHARHLPADRRIYTYFLTAFSLIAPGVTRERIR